ncbi:MAG TPA: LacI family DNA-binding transcriptional regulator [Devosiaceae bacterium]
MVRVTLRKIAEHTGLSEFAVSRALAGKSGVSDKTRRRVIEAAAAIGYKRAPSASALKTIGMVFDDTEVINSELNMQIQSGARQQAQGLGLGVRVYWSHDDAELEKFAFENDGLIIAGAHNAEGLARAYATQTPIVRTGWLSPLEPVDAVSTTDRDAGIATAQYLAKLGHREIVFAHGAPLYRGRRERLQGLREVVETTDGMRLHNLTWDENGSFREALMALRAQGHNPTAYACSHDGLAIAVVSELMSLGYRIPEDASIVGYGDYSAAMQIFPHLTTVKVPGVEMGEMAVRLLNWRINAELPLSCPLRLAVPCRFIERASTAPRPTGS